MGSRFFRLWSAQRCGSVVYGKRTFECLDAQQIDRHAGGVRDGPDRFEFVGGVHRGSVGFVRADENSEQPLAREHRKREVAAQRGVGVAQIDGFARRAQPHHRFIIAVDRRAAARTATPNAPAESASQTVQRRTARSMVSILRSITGNDTRWRSPTGAVRYVSTSATKNSSAWTMSAAFPMYDHSAGVAGTRYALTEIPQLMPAATIANVRVARRIRRAENREQSPSGPRRRGRIDQQRQECEERCNTDEHGLDEQQQDHQLQRTRRSSTTGIATAVAGDGWIRTTRSVLPVASEWYPNAARSAGSSMRTVSPTRSGAGRRSVVTTKRVFASAAAALSAALGTPARERSIKAKTMSAAIAEKATSVMNRGGNRQRRPRQSTHGATPGRSRRSPAFADVRRVSAAMVPGPTPQQPPI